MRRTRAETEIREETSGDVAAIEEITRRAFADHPHSRQTEVAILRGLRRSGALATSLVAVEHGRVVGHVAVSPVTVSDGAPAWHALGPVSVLPERQRRGIGSALVRAALARHRELGASGCVLVGEPAFYGRFGFRAEPWLVLPGVPPAYFQAIAFVEPLPRGTVTHHPAFEAT